jgi:hypothetical protein
MMRLEQRGKVAFTCMGIAVMVIPADHLVWPSVLATRKDPRRSRTRASHDPHQQRGGFRT